MNERKLNKQRQDKESSYIKDNKNTYEKKRREKKRENIFYDIFRNTASNHY